jgi:Tfp pilus assembly protein FimT
MIPRGTPAFTLVELILVMALLTTIMALSIPSLARSFRQRNLEQEAARILALTEYGREEAISEGVPMTLWIDTEKGLYGVEALPGYVTGDVRRKQYALEGDLRFDLAKAVVDQENHVQAAQFAADGELDPSDGVDAIRIVDHSGAAMVVSRALDGLSYEIVKEEK